MRFTLVKILPNYLLLFAPDSHVYHMSWYGENVVVAPCGSFGARAQRIGLLLVSAPGALSLTSTSAYLQIINSAIYQRLRATHSSG